MAQFPTVSALILIGGAVRSGKSAFALELATSRGPRRGFLATAQPGDAEMAQRIAHHQAERGDAFETVEEPIDVPGALETLADRDVVVIDCVTVWLANLLERELRHWEILARVDRLVSAAAKARAAVIVVANEVGMGIVPATPLGRSFRDVAGFAHQRLSAAADEIYFASMGTIMKLRPSPLEVRREPTRPGGRR